MGMTRAGCISGLQLASKSLLLFVSPKHGALQDLSKLLPGHPRLTYGQVGGQPQITKSEVAPLERYAKQAALLLKQSEVRNKFLRAAKII